MLPAVAEVVGVHGLCAALAHYVEKPCGAFAGGTRQSHEPLIRIGCSEPLLTDAKLMHVAVFPPHGQLQHVMQLFQSQIRRHQQPAPDRRTRAEQSDLDLINLLWTRGLFGWHTKPSSILRYGAPRCVRSASVGRSRLG